MQNLEDAQEHAKVALLNRVLLEAKGPRPERKKLGEVALVMRVPKEEVAYIDAAADGRPRTVWLRKVLAKGDAKLGKLLEPA